MSVVPRTNPDIEQQLAEFAPSQSPQEPTLDSVATAVAGTANVPVVPQPFVGMPAVDDSDDANDNAARKVANQQRESVTASLATASRVDPNLAAEADKLGKRFGVGQDIALRNIDTLRNRARLEDANVADLVKTDPVLARMLADPAFASQASDDIGVLRILNGIKNEFERLRPPLPSTSGIGLAVAGGPIGILPALNLYAAEAVKHTATTAWDIVGLGFERGRAVAERGDIGAMEMAGLGSPAALDKAEYLQKRMQEIGQLGLVGSAAEMFGQNVANAKIIGTSAAAGALIGLPAGVPGIIAGGSYGTGAGIVISTAKMESGNLYLDLRAEGVPDSTAIPAAIIGGTINGFIELIGFKIAAAPFKKLLSEAIKKELIKQLKTATGRAAIKTAGKAYGVQVLSQGLEEGIQETVIITAEEVSKRISGIHSDTTLWQAAERIVESFLYGTMASALLGGIGPGANLIVDLNRAKVTSREQVALTALENNKAESKLADRNLPLYLQLLEAQLNGTPLETIYIEAEVLREVLEKNEVTLAQLEEIFSGIGKQFKNAVDTSGDLTIPTAEYVAKLSGTPLGNALRPHIRGSAGSMSAAEAIKFEAKREATLAQAKQLLAEQQAINENFEMGALQVEQQAFEQVMATGQYSEQEARAIAQLRAASVVVDAVAQGMTPMEWQMKYGKPLSVRGEGIQAPTTPMEQAVRPEVIAQRRSLERMEQQLSDEWHVVEQEWREAKQTRDESANEAEWEAANTRLQDVRDRQRDLEAQLARIQDQLQELPEPPTIFQQPTPREQAARIDTDYLAAVERGDMETAQRMVDEAAANTPNKIDGIGFHYTSRDFTEFDNQAARTQALAEYEAAAERARIDPTVPPPELEALQPGWTTSFGRSYVFPDDAFFFFLDQAPPTTLVQTQNRKLLRVHLYAQKMLDLSKVLSGAEFSAIADWMQREFNTKPTPGHAGFTVSGSVVGGLRRARKDGVTPEQLFAFINDNSAYRRGDVWRKLMTDLGYDAIKFNANSSGTALLEPQRGVGDGKTYTVVAVLNNTQVKLADPVTYDEAGNVVPLSRRFDITSPRLFEQAATLDTDYLAAVERGDMETAKRIKDKAKMAAGYNRRGYHGLASGQLRGGEFDVGKLGSNTNAPSAKLGFFFSTRRQARTAEAYAYDIDADKAREYATMFQDLANELKARVPKKYHKELVSSLQEELERGKDAFFPIADVDEVTGEPIARSAAEYYGILSDAGLAALEDVLRIVDMMGYAGGIVKSERGSELEKWAEKTWLKEWQKLAARASKQVKGTKSSIFTAALRTINPLVHDYKGKSYREESYASVIARAKQLGHDSVILRNTYDGGGLDDIVVVFEPSQIKSDDTVTYDEAGNVVPLSRRFDITSPKVFEQAGRIDAETQSINEAATAVSDDVAKADSQPEIPQAIDNAAALDEVGRLATGQTWARGRDLKEAMQNRVLALAANAGVNLSLDTPQTTEYLTRIGYRDALYALRQNPNSVGWYDEKTRQAIAVMALVHPELLTDENARFAFTWALAVTSNGIEVGKNFELADSVYRTYKATGKMPTDLTAGQAQAAINRSLGMFNELRDAWGIDNLRRFAQTEYTIQELRYIVDDFDAGGEFAETTVKGAGILGPKIGNGFFSNLYGDFRSLTMDRWLIRTWGRWTGTLIKAMPVQTQKARSRLGQAVMALDEATRTTIASILRDQIPESQQQQREVIDALSVGKDVDLDVLSTVIQKASMDTDARAALNESMAGQEIRKSGNSLAKYLDGQKEAPAGPGERVQIRSVFASILQELQKLPEYADLTMADLQAALWYAEKRLYETAKEDIQVDEESIEGYADDEAPDYANAASNVARSSGVSDKQIQATLAKESNSERSRRARLQDEQGKPVAARDQGPVGGFTAKEKRSFNGAAVIRNHRASRGGNAGQPWAYQRSSAKADAKPRLVKKLGAQVVAKFNVSTRLRNALKAAGGKQRPFSAPSFLELEPGERSAQAFHRLISESKQKNAYGASVYAYPVGDYASMRLFVTEDLQSGFALKPDGDIVSVFSMADSGAGHAIVQMAVSQGGRKLDAFETVLPYLYAPHGFRVVSRLRWDESQKPDGWDKKIFKEFNNGEPDVVFMVYDPMYYGQHSKNDGKVATSYDAAVRAQTREVTKVEQAAARGQARDGSSPTPPVGTGVRFDQAPVSPNFYSALAKAVDAVDAKSMAASGWKERIKGLVNKGEVKQDEVEWSGLTDWLDMQEGKVTKEAVAEFLKNNGVRVERVQFGEEKTTINAMETGLGSALIDIEEADAMTPEVQNAFEEYESELAQSGPFTVQRWERLTELASIINPVLEANSLADLDEYFQDASEAVEDEDTPLAKFEQHTLPGGMNYREVLITLPEFRGVITETAETLLKRGFRVEQTYDELYDATDAIIYDNKGNRVFTTTRRRGKYSDEDLLREFAKNRRARQQRQILRDSYVGPHWDQPNVLVHFRLNDRVDADGKRVLFVEEIQSDWGQAGRKKGFKGQMTVAQIQKAADSDRQRFYSGMGDMSQEEWSALSERVRQWDEQENAAKSAVPLAPFVENTDGWLNLALKHILLEATQDNYDRVAFINGKQSADRYDLSKQVHKISWTEYDLRGANKLVTITPLQGNLIEIPIDARGIAVATGNNQFDGKPLDEIVPKEIADQIMAERSGDISGDGLKVGGKGMMEFYDKIVPAAVNKLLKKYGGGKLTATEIQFSQTATQMTMSGTIRFESSNDVDDFLIDMSAAGYEELDYGRSDENELEVYFSGFNQNQFNDASNMYGGYNGRAIELNRTDVPVSATASEQLGFDVTANMRETVSGGLPLFQAMPAGGPARGGIDPRTLDIIVGKGGDVSTLVHEMMHLRIGEYLRMASSGMATAQVLADLDILFNFMGVEGATAQERLDNYLTMPLEQRRPLEEKATYNFELYVYEGKSPSVELRGVFARLSMWLRRVYKSIRDDLNAIYRREFGTDLPILTPEVRGVFDRMLASEEQIRRQEAVNGMKGLFQSKDEAIAAGMSEAEWAAYQDMQQEATNDAVAQLGAATMRQMQWMSNARARVMRDLQRQHTAKRKEVAAEVSAAIKVTPVYRAMTYLRLGRFVDTDGQEVDMGKPHRLDIDQVNAMYAGMPEDARPDIKALGTGRNGMLEKGGLSPDVVAELFGYSSGDEMIRAMLAAKPMKDAVAERTDEVMVQRYGDMNSPAAVEAEVQKALHNEARARLVAVELRFLAKATQPVRLILEAARQVAADIIDGTVIREVRPNQYMAAEARAARDADRIQRTYDITEPAEELVQRYGRERALALVRAKQAQLYQNQLATAAIEAKEYVAKQVKYLRRVLKDENVKRMGAAAADQIAELLKRFEVAEVTLKRLDTRTTMAQYLADQEAAGVVPDIASEIVDESRRVNYRQMKVSEFRDLVDAVRQIEHVGKNEQKMRLAEERAAFAEKRDEIVTRIREVGKERGLDIDPRTPLTGIGRTVAALRGFAAQHLKAASVARILDGGKDDGPLYNAIIRTANAAADTETTMRAKASLRLGEILKPVFALGGMGGKGIFFPSIGRSLNREARLAIALNMGNDGNRQRLLDGEGWTIEQIQPVIESLTEAEWLAVQQVWDFIDGYRPEIAAKERRLYGKEPKWVEPVPFTVRTLDGKQVTLQGGYYPVKYDPVASDRVATVDAVEEAKRDLHGAYTAATTRRSFVKARAKEVVDRPILYTLDAAFSGVNDVIHDLAWHEWLISTNRLLRDTQFANAVRETRGPEFLKQLRDWTKDNATGGRGQQVAGEAALSWLRQGISASGLGFNVVSAAMQLTGFNQSIVRVGAKYIGQGIVQFATSPLESVKTVAEKSSFMAERGRTQFREINEIKNRVRGQTEISRRVFAGTYFLMMNMQRSVDIPTWLGAYQKALDASKDDATAVALADQAVRDSQGSGLLSDLAAVERGGPLMKLFTVFYSYMNTVFNMTAVQTMTATSRGKLAADYAMLLVVPVVLGYAIKSAIQPDADDDELDPEALARKLAAEELSYLMGTMVIVREFGGAAQLLTGAEGVRMGYGGPAGLRAVGEVYGLATQAKQLEFDRAFRKSAINTLGAFTGLPSAQINRTIDGIEALIEGEVEGPTAILAPLTGVQR